VVSAAGPLWSLSIKCEQVLNILKVLSSYRPCWRSLVVVLCLFCSLIISEMDWHLPAQPYNLNRSLPSLALPTRLEFAYLVTFFILKTCMSACGVNEHLLFSWKNLILCGYALESETVPYAMCHRVVYHPTLHNFMSLPVYECVSINFWRHLLYAFCI
jgi:hypothetical protein